MILSRMIRNVIIIYSVIPAKAGTHDLDRLSSWVPAFAGMTMKKSGAF